jgi:HTH-type transcriptional regulator, bacterioopsin transcriptional activator and related proteins
VEPAAERLFGWTAGEVLGGLLPFIPEEKREEHRRMRQRDLRGESFTGLEVRRVRKDGTPIDISVSTAPLHDAAGR